jgi:ribosome-binding protein aMBF1 (putative translation factor)
MAKYSTGSGGSGDAGSCELCGAEGGSLRETEVAGATLAICGDCRDRHGSASGGEGRGRGQGQGRGSRDPDEQDRKTRAVRNTARVADARQGNPERWQEGTDYERDPLPYLVSGYGDRLAEARREAGLAADELAGELGVDEADLLAVEQGRANSAGVGGSLIDAIEERLNVQLAEGSD